MKFIHDGQVVIVQSAGDMFIYAESVLHDDLFMIGFTFDEVQTLEIEDFCRWPCRLNSTTARWCSI